MKSKKLYKKNFAGGSSLVTHFSMYVKTLYLVHKNV